MQYHLYTSQCFIRLGSTENGPHKILNWTGFPAHTEGQASLAGERTHLSLSSNALVPFFSVVPLLHSPGYLSVSDSIILKVLFSLSFLPMKRTAELTPPSTHAWGCCTWQCFKDCFFSFLQREKQKGENGWRDCFPVIWNPFWVVEVTGEEQCSGTGGNGLAPICPQSPREEFFFSLLYRLLLTKDAAFLLRDHVGKAGGRRDKFTRYWAKQAG